MGGPTSADGRDSGEYAAKLSLFYLSVWLMQVVPFQITTAIFFDKGFYLEENPFQRSQGQRVAYAGGRDLRAAFSKVFPLQIVLSIHPIAGLEHRHTAGNAMG